MLREGEGMLRRRRSGEQQEGCRMVTMKGERGAEGGERNETLCASEDSERCALEGCRGRVRGFEKEALHHRPPDPCH